MGASIGRAFSAWIVVVRYLGLRPRLGKGRAFSAERKATAKDATDAAEGASRLSWNELITSRHSRWTTVRTRFQRCRRIAAEYLA